MSAEIQRAPGDLAGESFDLIVVGGGIYGATLLLEAAQAGLRGLLLEREDFGSGTSSNHFRIGHGGLRYLQSLDLRRFRESVEERRWLLATFPELVRPLRCVMPLYGRGLRRPTVMRGALAANDLLSRGRNRGVRPRNHLPRGEVIGPADVLELFPGIRREGLEGAAVWYDASFAHGNRVLIECLRWACALGSSAQNYVAVTDIVVESGKVGGVEAADRLSGEHHRYRAPVVVNAAGPWVDDVAALAPERSPRIFHRSRAWNVVFDRPPIGQGALAVEAPEAGARTYFVRQAGERLFIGTGHAPGVHRQDPSDPAPSESELASFVAELDRAIPSLDLGLADVHRVLPGFLPASRPDSVDLAGRPTVVDHGRTVGPEGLISVAGVKYTTARRVAEQVVRIVRRRFPRRLDAAPPSIADEARPPVRVGYALAAMGEQWRVAAETIIREESVVCLDDLVRRRTDLADHPDRLGALSDELESLLADPFG